MATTSSFSSSLPLTSSSSTLLDLKASLRHSAIGVTLQLFLLQLFLLQRHISTRLAHCLRPLHFWDKLEDKYAVSSLLVAAGVGLIASTGVISTIDKLPLVPGVLELVGIGYTGYFAYKNLIFKPERDALIQKVKETYKEIIGSS